MKKRSVSQHFSHALWFSSSLLLIVCTLFFYTGSVSARTTTPAAPQSNCPAPGSARAAVMPSTPLGTDSNLVYIFNDVPSHTSTSFGRLIRYDVVTQKRTEIVNSGLSLQSAQVSANGQWILFVTTPDPRGDRDHSALLQLVRIDGQDLQTLYCAPTGTSISHLQWATDTKLIAFSFNKSSGGSGLTFLNARDGSLQTDLVNARSSTNYQPLTWLDTSRLYLLSPTIDGPASSLFILDTKLGPNQTTAALKQAYSAPDPFCWNADSSYDGRSLFTSGCTSVPDANHPGLDGVTGPSNIALHPATGGSTSVIFSNQKLAITAIRAINKTTLLVLVQNHQISKQVDTSQDGLWKVNTDGTSFTRLTQDPKVIQVFCSFTQFPWSNVSRNGQYYGVQTNDGQANTTTSMLLGSFNSSSQTTVASVTSPSEVALVGWTSK